MSTRMLLLAACAAGLTGCHIPALRNADAPPNLPTDFNTPAETPTTENSARLSVDEFFTDPLLTGLIHQGMDNNRELKALTEEVEIAKAEILARRGAFMPMVTFGARAGLDKPSRFTPQGAVEDQLQFEPGKPFPDPLPNFVGGFNFFMPLDVWREYRNARDAARQRYFAAIERRADFITKLTAEIADNYYKLMALDQRRATLNLTIDLQQQSVKAAASRKDAVRGTELAVQRFTAEVKKNQSELAIVSQEIVEAENRINFLVNRYPQPVERVTSGFFDLTIQPLQAGVPADLLLYRPDIRQAEREMAAAGLDVKVARAHFFPRMDLAAGIGLEALNLSYIFLTPGSLIYGVAGNLVAPVINRAAIKAEYASANARQLQAVYNYQKAILNGYVEVVNRITMADNYRKSVAIKKEQVEALNASVDIATKLFINARAEYVEVLLAQRDMMDARLDLIDAKRQQLSAIVNAYQALGGGSLLPAPTPVVEK